MKGFHKILMRIRWYWENHPKAFGVIIGATTFILTAIFSGLIENITAGWFLSVLVPWLKEKQEISNLVLVVGSVVVLVFGSLLSATLCGRSKETEYPSKLFIANVLDSAASHYRIRTYLDVLVRIDNLLRESWDYRTSSSALASFVDKFYIMLFQYVSDDLNGGGVLLPCPDDRDWLCFWRSAPDTTLSSKRFYIGSEGGNGYDNKKIRGSSGKVFVENRPRIIKIINRKKGIANDPDFYYFEIEHRRASIPYAAFVSIPIHWRDNVIGVLTIESSKPDTFTQDDIPFLQILADKLGDALILHDKVNLENI